MTKEEKTWDKGVLLVLISIVILGGLATWQFWGREKVVVHNEAPAKKALSISEEEGKAFTDMQGNPADLSLYLGQILIVNSWASWSPFSATELPLLVNIANSHLDLPIKIIAINRAENKQTAERFLRDLGVLDGVELVLDPDDHFYKSIGGYAMPETLIYDKKGEIIHHKRGQITENDVELWLEQIQK